MERSGLDMLEEILKRLDFLEKRLTLIDSNVKSLMNDVRFKPNTQAPKPTAAPTAPPTENKGFKHFKFEPTNPDQIEKKKTTMVEGRLAAMVEGKQVGLGKISVKIFDPKDQLIKETKTNAAGAWVAYLPPGDYCVLFEGIYNGKPIVPQNKNFHIPVQLPAGQTKVEVK